MSNHFMPTPCDIASCQQPVHARGYCSNHYSLLRKQGNLPKIVEQPRFKENTKWCRQCSRYLPFDMFGKDRRNLYELSTYCRVCRSKVSNQTKRPYTLKPKSVLYQQLLEKQEGRCAICGNAPSGQRADQVLHEDHCHKTNTVRGLLCGCCNRGLGLFKDNVTYLENARAYLVNS